MLIQGNEDLRVQKTMACIDRAFCELMLERDYGDITVAELCRRARIQRKTFYVYYASIDELLREKLGEVSRRYIERISRYAVPEQIAEVNLEFYRYSAEQGELYERIVCSAACRDIGSALLEDLVRRTWQDSSWFRSLGECEQDVFLAFIFGTGAALYRQWVAGGKKVPLERMAELAGRLLKEGADGFAKAVDRSHAPSGPARC